MRSLRRSADLVVRALCFWHQHFCTTESSDDKFTNDTDRAIDELSRISGSFEQLSMKGHLPPLPIKTPSTLKRWNLDAKSINDTVFTTVYTADLKALIEDLSAGKIKKKKCQKIS